MHLHDAEKKARALMHQHGVGHWAFMFDNAKRRAGQCNYRKQRIQLSKHATTVRTAEQVTDTILHEIGHALAPRGAGHGPEWVRVARSIGCTGARCVSIEEAPRKFTGTCPNCSREIKRHKRTFTLACGTCCRAYNNGRHHEKYIFMWRSE